MPDIPKTYNYHLVEKHAAWTEAGPVVSRLPEPEIAILEGRAAATVADPSTLALFGFATGTWITGVVFGGYLNAELPLARSFCCSPGPPSSSLDVRVPARECSRSQCLHLLRGVQHSNWDVHPAGSKRYYAHGCAAGLHHPGLFQLLFRVRVIGPARRGALPERRPERHHHPHPKRAAPGIDPHGPRYRYVVTPPASHVGRAHGRTN
jgi:hypothetical protein